MRKVLKVACICPAPGSEPFTLTLNWLSGIASVAGLAEDGTAVGEFVDGIGAFSGLAVVGAAGEFVDILGPFAGLAVVGANGEVVLG